MTLPILLEGGLDLRNPAPLIKPGRLSDCLNYETRTDVKGYKVMDGFDRFDGSQNPGTTDLWGIKVPNDEIPTGFHFGYPILVNGVEVAEIVGRDGRPSPDHTVIVIVYYPGAKSIKDDDVITTYGGTLTLSSTIRLLPFVELYEDAETMMSRYVEYTSNLNIRPVPGMGPTLAAKMFNRNVYAIRNLYKFNFTSAGLIEPKVNQRIIYGGLEGIIDKVELDGGEWLDGDAFGKITVGSYDNQFRYVKERPHELVGEIRFEDGVNEPAAEDVIVGASSGSVAVVHRVETLSGAWSNGTAKGIIYIKTETSSFASLESINNTTTATSSVVKCTKQTHKSQVSALISGSIEYADTDRAAMWESSLSGWKYVDLGWEVRFDTGTNEPPTINIGGSVVDLEQSSGNTGWMSAANVYHGPTKYNAPWTGLTAANLESLDGSKATFTNTFEVSSSVSMWNFGFSLKPSDTVLGIEVEFNAQQTSGTKNAGFIVEIGNNYSPPRILRQAPTRSDYPGWPINSGSMVNHIIGGPADNWSDGMSPIISEQVNKTNFGMRWHIRSKSGTSDTTYAVDSARIRITYLPAAAKVYFWDGVDDIATAVLTQNFVSKGSYENNDAEGIYTLAELTAHDFGAGIEIRTLAGGGGVLIAKTSSGPTRNHLPGSALLAENNSKYELMVENFYASTDLNALWGVSGAGPAFSYDGEYFRRVRTGMLESKDKPRHLSAFQFRLVLGYEWGEANMSVAGDPLSFDGVLNASSFGFGHSIVGIRQLNGQTLGVFTKGGVFGLSGSSSNIEQKLLIPNSKVIEHSVQPFGDDVIYLDQNGVRTASATEKYGDFEGGTLSENVNRWLRPRLQGGIGVRPRDISFNSSTIVRKKGQYRMHFNDGYWLTMSWDKTSDPQFTWQRPQLRSDSYTNDFIDWYLTVVYATSDIDDDGREFNFFAIKESAARNNPIFREQWGQVWASDVGSTWSGEPFDASLTISWINAGDSTYNKRFTKWQLYGEAYNYSKANVSFEPDLGNPEDSPSEAFVIGDPKAPPTLETTPFFTTLRSTERGRNIAIRFSGNSKDLFPHTLQLLVAVRESRQRTET